MNARIVRITLVVLMTVPLLAQVAQAQPPLPFRTRGTVTVNGEKVPAGTVITAWCGGVQAGETVTFDYEGDSLYAISIYGDSDEPGKDGCTDGETVSYRIDVDELLADQTATWIAGGGPVTVNLTAFRPLPELGLVKQLNGLHIEDPPGPFLLAGETVTFTYLVSNVGNVELEQVVVTDDQETGLSCGWPLLTVGEASSCTITATTVSGAYHNVGTALGVFSSTLYGTSTVTVTDQAYYYNSFYIYLPLVLRN